MKKYITKIVIGIFSLYNLSYSDEKLVTGLGDNTLKKQSVHYVNNISSNKNFLKKIRYKALSSIAKTLNLNPKIFDNNQKFSLYVKVASTKKIGFRYKF